MENVYQHGSGATCDDINPASGEVIAEVSLR